MTRVHRTSIAQVSRLGAVHLPFASRAAFAFAVPVGFVAAVVIGSVPLAALIAAGTAACILLADLMI